MSEQPKVNGNPNPYGKNKVGAVLDVTVDKMRAMADSSTIIGDPIVVDGIQEVSAYINPIPSGLVLTGIVVSVSVSALMLSLTIRLYKRYHTLDLDEISARLRKEGL